MQNKRTEYLLGYFKFLTERKQKITFFHIFWMARLDYALCFFIFIAALILLGFGISGNPLLLTTGQIMLGASFGYFGIQLSNDLKARSYINLLSEMLDQQKINQRLENMKDINKNEQQEKAK